jgi:hypothetical protein
MPSIDEESKRYIQNNEELRYEQFVDQGKLSSVPTAWLKIFLERTKDNERAREEFVRREVLEGKKPLKSDVLAQKIAALKDELAKRKE